MIRAAAFLILAMFAAMAFIASNRAKPMLIDAHSSGAWNFHNVSAPIGAPYRVVPCRIERAPRGTAIHQA